jgi:hypothetical protein
VFPQGSIETNALFLPMPIEFELDYEISFTIVATIGQGCNFLWLSPFTRRAQPMFIKLDFGSPYLSHHGHLYLYCFFFHATSSAPLTSHQSFQLSLTTYLKCTKITPMCEVTLLCFVPLLTPCAKNATCYNLGDLRWFDYQHIKDPPLT